MRINNLHKAFIHNDFSFDWIAFSLTFVCVDFQILCCCGIMCVILSCNSIHFIRQFQSFYVVKHVKLHDNLAYFIA